MDRSVAQGRPADPDEDLGPAAGSDPRIAAVVSIAVGLGLVVAALAVYSVTATDRFYNHFVWQASAFLEGQAAIRYPVPATAGSVGNALFQDVLPVVTSDGVPRGLLPFPPLPAVVLLPFVAIWGLATDDRLIFTILAAIDIALCWWMVGRLPVRSAIRLATTIFFAFGTVFWYTAQIATTWYQAHIVAVGLMFLAIGLALGGDRGAAEDEPDEPFDPDDLEDLPDERPGTGGRSLGTIFAVDPRQFLAGFLFGLAGTARLTVLFGAPFFLFVGSGGGWRRRGWSAALGAAVPVLALVLYNVVSSGHVFNPAYDYLYRLEAYGYPMLGYHPSWGLEDPRYLPQNIGIGMLGVPDIFPVALPDSMAIHPTPVCTDPGAVRGLFDIACPLVVPKDTGMSVFLTSPAFLLALPALRRYGRNRVVTGSAIAVLLIVVVNLMHFSQGWVQFGYRFSIDAAPFALLLVALGLERLADRRSWGLAVGMTLVVASVAINFWGVAWSRMLGW